MLHCANAGERVPGHVGEKAALAPHPSPGAGTWRRRTAMPLRQPYAQLAAPRSGPYFLL